MTQPKWDSSIAVALESPAWWDAKVAPWLLPAPSGCIEWQRALNKGGYGRVSLPASAAKRHNGDPPTVMVHRVAWIRENGAVDVLLDVDHLCRNRACANPMHLEAKTRRENLQAPGSLSMAAIAQRRTDCLGCGEPILGENLLLITGKYRACRACRKRREHERAALVREAHMAMGMSQTSYRALYGMQRTKAREILNLLATGMSPDEVRASLEPRP